MKRLFTTICLGLTTMFGYSQTNCYFQEDMEIIDVVTSNPANAWAQNTRIHVSGIACDSGQVQNNSTTYLETDPIDLTGFFYVTLSFQHICRIDFFDYANPEVSIDGGLTWTTLTPAEFDQTLPDYAAYAGQGYFSSATTLDWDPGVPGTVPTNAMWHLARFDLSQFGGVSDFRLRFKLLDNNGGGAGGYPGWFIDDICIQADVCELVPPTIAFNNGYPQGTVYNLGPFTIVSNITDASGILVANLNYSVNGGAVNTVPMTDLGGGAFSGLIPAVNDGDTICYSIVALDNSGCFNTSTFPTSGCITFIASQGITFPFCDNFDQQNLWTDSIATASSTSWQRGQSAIWPGSAHSNPNIWEVGLDQQYANNCTSYLYSPTFSFLGVFNAQIELWINSDTEFSWDGVRLEYSTNGGSTWNTLGTNNTTFPTGINWYNDDQLNSSQTYAWMGSSQDISGTSGWFKAMHNLSMLDNQTSVMFRFVFTSDGSVTDNGFAIDDVCIFVPPAQDAGVSLISQPSVQAPAGNCVPVEVTITNYGSQPITSTPVTYTDGQGQTQTATWTGSLAPGASTQFTITPCYTIPSGPFSICAYTSLPNDGLAFNDTTCMSGTGVPVLTLSSCDDFESGNVGWISTPTGGQNSWQLGTPAFGATTGAYSGTNAWDINLTSGYVANEIDTLYSPIYDVTGLTASNLTMSFYRNHNTANTDGFWVEYTINGNTWSMLGSLGDPNASNWYNTGNLNFTNLPAFTGNSNGWVKSTYFLNNILASNPTIIRFRFIFSSATFSTGGAGVSIDNFCVNIPCSPDAGITSVGSYNVFLGNTLAQGALDSVRVTIHNYGTAPLTTLDVYYAINGTPVLPPYTWTGNLTPNGNATFILPTTYATPGGQYTITAWTNLTGDCEPANDTLAGTAVGVPVIAVDYNNAYCDDFENGNIGWSTKIVGDPGTYWELGTPNYGTTNTAYSGSNCWDINLNGPYTNNANSELYTPIFDFTNAVDPRIEFWQNVASETNWDGVRMEYRIGNGPWTVLGTPCDTVTLSQINWYNDNQLNSSQQYAWTQGNSVCNLPAGWIRSFRRLEPIFNNQPQVQFRYIFTSDGSVITDGYSIDNFCVSVPVPLTVTPINVSTAVPSGPPFIFPGQSIPFKSKIFNDGTSVVNSLVATLSVDGTMISNDTITLSNPFNPGTSLNYTFLNNWTASPGYHTVCVSTYYPNQSADLKPIGDTTCYTIQVFDSATVGSGAVSKCYDFESGVRWVTLNATSYTSNSSWDLGTAVKLGGPHSPVNSWFTNLTGQYPNRDTSALFSPIFTITGGLTYNINFWHSFKTERNEDGGTFEYSTNYGNTWNSLGDERDPNWMNTYSITALGPVPPVHPGWSGNSGGWNQVNHDFCYPVSGQHQVIFRWRFNSDFSVRDDGWAIDDVCFEVKSPLTLCVTGIEELSNALDLMQNNPNPFSDYSNVTFTLNDAGATQLDVVDITGKVIMSPVQSNLAAGTYNITISAEKLASGVYFYVLKHNDNQIVRKMVVAK